MNKRKLLVLIGVAVLIGVLLLVFLSQAEQEVPRWGRDWEEFDCGEKTMTALEARDLLLQEYGTAVVQVPGEVPPTAKVIPVVVWNEKAAEVIPECVGGWPIQVVLLPPNTGVLRSTAEAKA